MCPFLFAWVINTARKWQGPVNTSHAGNLAALMSQLELLHPIQIGTQG